MSLTADEVKALVSDNYDDETAFYDTIEWSSEGLYLGDYIAKGVESHGGEGQGDRYENIFQIGDQFFRATGYYSSWDGVNWDDVEVEEVAEVEKLVKVWDVV